MADKCILCGVESIFTDHLCLKCYLDTHDPLYIPRLPLTFSVCELCETIYVGDQSFNFYLADYKTRGFHKVIFDFVLQKWKFKSKNVKFRLMDLVLHDSIDNSSTIVLDGNLSITIKPDPFIPEITLDNNIEIVFNWGRCPECRSRLEGKYLSKLQIRINRKVEPDEIEKWESEIKIACEKMTSKMGGKNPLFRVVYEKSGIDFEFRKRSAAEFIGKDFSRKHGGRITHTTEFAGYDPQKSREYPRRQVILVDLPPYSVGDVILIDNQIMVQILGFKPGKVDVWDYHNHSIKSIQNQLLWKDSVELVTTKQSDEYQIINFEKENDVVQIMRMKDYSIIYCHKEELVDLSEGDIFQAFEIDDGSILRDHQEYE